jgi:malonyl-CoA O-methyltransferase
VVSQKNMLIQKEFSKYANCYDQFNIIQKKVAKELLSKIPHKNYHLVVDLGSGNGTIYKGIDNQFTFDDFFALDNSKEMLSLHPDDKKVTKLNYDFNTQILSDINIQTIDLLISSSSLQWCNDLDYTIGNIVSNSQSIALAIFTNNTFKSLHKTASIKSPITSKEYILNSLSKQKKVFDIEIKEYKLYFESKQDIFKYIKQSGVSGGDRRLSYKQTKKLIEDYPYNFLEFEVVFATYFDKRH